MNCVIQNHGFFKGVVDFSLDYVMTWIGVVDSPQNNTKTDPCIDFFLNIKHMSYVSSGNKRFFYVEFVSMKKIMLCFLWFFVFGCFYSSSRHFIKNGKNNKNEIKNSFNYIHNLIEL